MHQVLRVIFGTYLRLQCIRVVSQYYKNAIPQNGIISWIRSIIDTNFAKRQKFSCAAHRRQATRAAGEIFDKLD